MKGFLEFIRRLFSGGKKKKPLSPAAVINDIIAGAAGMNLAFITGEERSVTANRVKFADFERAVGRAGAGYVLDAFESDERPRASMFFPAPFIETYFSIMKKTHEERCADEDRALDLLMDWLDGTITRLLFLENGGVRSFYRMKKPFAAEDTEALLWLASGCAIIAVSDGKRSFYLLVEEGADRRLKKDVARDDFRKAVRALVLTEYDRDLATEDDAGVEDIVLTIAKPVEFILGRFFLPVKVAAGAWTLSSRFEKIIIPADGVSYSSHEAQWMKLALKADGDTRVAYYCFRDRENGAVARALASTEVFRAVLKETMIFLKSNCRSMQLTAIQFQAGARPDAEEAAGCAILSATVKYDYRPVQALVFVTQPFLLMLAARLFSPWEMRLLQYTMRNRLLSVLSLNRTVFSRGIKTFVKDLGAGSIPMPIAITCLPFYEFIDLVGDGDLKIIIQNYLAPKYGPSYRRLFTISVSENDGESAIARSRIVEVEYDRSRFDRFLPAMLKDADDYWRYSSSTEQFDAVNREAMQGLFRAMETDRIVLSYRARYILVNQFHGIVQEEYAAQLDGFRRSGSPFEELCELNGRDRTLAVGRVSNEDLGMAVVAIGRGEDIVAGAMSETRRKEFSDDLAITRDRFRKDQVRPGDAVAGIRKILEAVEAEKKRAQQGKSGNAGRAR